MSPFPPEKYYEACITYHLVNEFQYRFDQTLYPISISQIEEHLKGYDFEYYFSGRSFFIQYKRAISLQNNIYSWLIDKKQLQIISNRYEPFKVFYALPAFSDIMEWYHGIDDTYFITATELSVYLQTFKGEKTNVINSTFDGLRHWEEIMRQFVALQGTVSTKYDHKVVTVEDIICFANSLDNESRECTWGYLLKENDHG